MSASHQIEISADGLPSFTLQEAMRGDGTERLGFGVQPGGSGPYVLFYAKSVPNGAASLDAGRPMFKSIVFMRLQHPGERDCLDRPATRHDAMRFPAEYRRYVEGRQDTPDGVPLHVLFPNHHDIVQALNYHKVHTVEQLAKLTDTQIQNLGMGGLEWQQKAQRYLAHLERGEGFAKYEEQIRRQQVDLDRAARLNQDLSAKLQALTNQVAMLMQNQMAAGGVPPGGLGIMPAAAAIPAQIQSNGFASPLPHEIGADDNVPSAPTSAPDEQLMGESDSFLEDLATPQAPRAGRTKRSV